MLAPNSAATDTKAQITLSLIEAVWTFGGCMFVLCAEGLVPIGGGLVKDSESDISASPRAIEGCRPARGADEDGVRLMVNSRQ